MINNFDKLSNGLAPYCLIICEALLVASFPQSYNVNFFENPNKNPAANKSPAPVVSRISSPSIGGINIDSFAEMDIQIVKNYLSMIDVKSNFLYTKNPVGKYERWMISKDDTNLNQKAVENAMSTGMIQDIVNINSQDEIIMASKNFIQAYKPSSRWSVRFDQWAKPWHYYWEAIYERKD